MQVFTGIIQAIGEVTAIKCGEGDVRMEVAAPALDFDELALGDSIAVNGVCLTITALAAIGFGADVSNETLGCTTLGALQPGAQVNLEMPATASTLLGGHIVLGHVDGIGTITGRRRDGRSVRLDVELPVALGRYVAAKGSVAIDGVSLTVNEVDGSRFGVNIIPHTLESTIIGEYAEGTRVNVECDIIARYLERLNCNAGS
jgi:riboflavin synthase